MTSKECLWNKPRSRKLSPKKSSELVFKKQKFSDESEKEVKTRALVDNKMKEQNNAPAVTPLNIQSLKEKLQKCNPHAAFVLGFEDTKDTVKEKLLKKSREVDFMLPRIPFMYHDKVNLTDESCVSEFRNYFTSLECSPTKCEFIERNTRGQHNNKNWEISRKGRVTSSNF